MVLKKEEREENQQKKNPTGRMLNQDKEGVDNLRTIQLQAPPELPPRPDRILLQILKQTDDLRPPQPLCAPEGILLLQVQIQAARHQKLGHFEVAVVRGVVEEGFPLVIGQVHVDSGICQEYSENLGLEGREEEID